MTPRGESDTAKHQKQQARCGGCLRMMQKTLGESAKIVFTEKGCRKISYPFFDFWSSFLMINLSKKTGGSFDFWISDQSSGISINVSLYIPGGYDVCSEFQQFEKDLELFAAEWCIINSPAEDE